MSFKKKLSVAIIVPIIFGTFVNAKENNMDNNDYSYSENNDDPFNIKFDLIGDDFIDKNKNFNDFNFSDKPLDKLIQETLRRKRKRDTISVNSENEFENKNESENRNESENKNKSENENESENRNEFENKNESENRNESENKNEPENENESENRNEFENKNESENKNEFENGKCPLKKINFPIPLLIHPSLYYNEFLSITDLRREFLENAVFSEELQDTDDVCSLQISFTKTKKNDNSPNFSYIYKLSSKNISYQDVTFVKMGDKKAKFEKVGERSFTLEGNYSSEFNLTITDNLNNEEKFILIPKLNSLLKDFLCSISIMNLKTKKCSDNFTVCFKIVSDNEQNKCKISIIDERGKEGNFDVSKQAPKDIEFLLRFFMSFADDRAIDLFNRRIKGGKL